MGERHHGMGTTRQFKRRLALHGVGQIAVSQCGPHRATHTKPAEAQGQGQRGFTILSDREIFFVGDVPEMRLLHVDADLKFVSVKDEVVWILNLDDQVQVAASQSKSPNDRVIQLNVRLPEVFSQSGASRSGKGEAYRSQGDGLG